MGKFTCMYCHNSIEGWPEDPDVRDRVSKHKCLVRESKIIQAKATRRSMSAPERPTPKPRPVGREQPVLF
jgi:hypothetical protein